MARRRIRKRQNQDRYGLKRPFDVMQTIEGVRQGYEIGKNLYQGAKVAHKAAKNALKGGSKTATKKKNDKNWDHVDTSGLKYKTVNISYKKSKVGKATKALSQPGTVYNYSTGGGTSSVGQQNAVTMMTTFGSDINTLYQGLNDGVALTGVRASEQLYFTGTTEEIEFNNCSPTTLEMEIYVLIDKTTSAAPPEAVNTWVNAITQESNDATVPVEAASTLWLKPTGYKGFNINFWTKRYDCVLTAGEKCKFTLNFKRNRLLDTSYTQNYSNVRGISHRIMIVHRGTLVDADNAKTFTAGNQSISETKLIWAWKRTMKGCILSTLPRVNKQIGLNFPTALAAQWHIDEDTGEPENAATTTEYA